MKKSEVFFIIRSFILWRVALFFVAYLAIYFIPIFGASFPYYDRVLEITHLPNWIWGFGNFDGVHYLRIAQDGYVAAFSQAFFPLFPLLIRTIASFIPKNAMLDTAIYTDPAFFYSGLILANSIFLAALFMFYKLIRLDFTELEAKRSIVFLLVFPTSFYFGSVYTESLFLLFTVASIYFVRKRSFILSGVFVSLATLTRIFGALLIIVYLIEVVRNKSKNKFLPALGLMIAPLGILAYTLYLKANFGDPLYFLTVQPMFGAERSSGQIILLPQVMYRYLKIFLATNISTLPFWNAMLEALFTIVPLVILVLFLKKMRFSYWFFCVSALILPTLTGTFSSMPRYALMAFLMIPYLANIVRNKKNFFILASILGVLAVILTTLFIRGYWVA